MLNSQRGWSVAKDTIISSYAHTRQRGFWHVVIFFWFMSLGDCILVAQEHGGLVSPSLMMQTQVQPPGYVSRIRYAPGGASLAIASNEKPLGLFDPQTLAEQALLEGHLGHIYDFAFFPDGKNLVSAGSDGTVRFWDLATRHERLRVEDFQGSVYGLALSPDGSRVFAGDYTKDGKGSIRSWSTSDGKLMQTLANYNAGVLSMTLSPDGSTLATVTRDHFVHFWATANLSEQNRFDARELHAARAIYCDQGRLLVVVLSDRTIQVFDTATLKLRYRFDPTAAASPTLAISPNSALLATTGKNVFQLRSVKTGDVVTAPIDFGERVSAVAFAPDSKHLVVGGARGTLRSYELDGP